MSTSKQSVTNAFNTIVFPVMSTDGFIKINNKLFARLLDSQILQWVSIYVSTQLKREYRIEYGTMLISVPATSFNSTIGGSFSKLSSGGTYGAKTIKMLELSIERVLIAYNEEVRPIFLNTSTLPKLIAAYKQLKTDDLHLYSTGHPEFNIACAYALLYDNSKSSKHAQIAIRNYKTIENEFKNQGITAFWPSEGIKQTEALLTALDKKNTETLFEKWKTFTIEQLKLSILKKT